VTPGSVSEHKIRLAKEFDGKTLTFELLLDGKTVTNHLKIGQENDVEVYPGTVKKVLLKQVDENTFEWKFDDKELTLRFIHDFATWVGTKV